MKPVKHFTSAAGVLAAVCLTALMGLGTVQAMNAPGTESSIWPTAKSGSLELTRKQQINRRLVASDRMLSVHENATWTKPLSHAAVYRIHAFRQIPGNSLTVAIAMSQDEATRAANFRRQQMALFTGCIAVLAMGLAMLLVRRIKLARLRGATMAADRALLTAANEQLGAALASANAKAGQLEATLAGMGDGQGCSTLLCRLD